MQVSCIVLQMLFLFYHFIKQVQRVGEEILVPVVQTGQKVQSLYIYLSYGWKQET